MRKFSNKFRTAAMAMLAVGCIWPGHAHSVELPNRWPRIANYYLTPTISLTEAERLARWDVVIIGVEHQYTNRQIFSIIRQKNPDIIILAYVPSEEIPANHALISDQNHPHAQLFRGVADGWWLTNPQGGKVSYWPGTNMLNVTDLAPAVNGQRWNTYLPNFVHDRIMSTGLWNGIFYDNVWPDIAWLNGGNIDLNRDGISDRTRLDTAWRDGMSRMLAESRRLEGNDTIIIGNGGGKYYTSMNGRLIEEFPSVLDGGWTGASRLYANVMRQGYGPAMAIVNSRPASGRPNEYRTMRYLLTSTMLDNGFFSFDEGQLRHAALWQYDEYQAPLGIPVTPPKNLLRPGVTVLEEGLWRRDFQHGAVFVNATDQERRIELGEGYEKLNGSQDRSVNDGQVVTALTVPPRDGIILLRRQASITNGQFSNGAITRVFSISGHSLRQGFFSYDQAIESGAEVIVRDVTGDGQVDRITAGQSKVAVSDHRGVRLHEFYPYGSRHTSGITIAVGDIDNDGQLEIITGTKPGAAPVVKIFALNGQVEHRGFYAYPKSSRGGVQVAAGDVHADSGAEIITGPGRGQKPWVRIFNERGKKLKQFYAYHRSFKGGVRVAAGDLIGGRRSEIITGAGPGGGPHVRVFSGIGRPIGPGFYAFDRKLRTGVFVGVSDLNQDHRDEIVVSSTSVY